MSECSPTSSQVLTGQIDAEILVSLSAEELASDDRRQENDKIRDYKKSECERGLKNLASTDMVSAPRYRLCLFCIY